MRKVILPSVVLGLLLSACQSTTSLPSASAAKPPVLSAQDVVSAKVTASKTVPVTYTDASGRNRGVISVTGQIRREDGAAYAVLTYSDTTDISGYGPTQTGIVELRNAADQKLMSSFRYGLNGPTRVYSLISTEAYKGEELNTHLCAAVNTELTDISDSKAPRIRTIFTVCETDAAPPTVPTTPTTPTSPTIPTTPVPPVPSVDPYAKAEVVASLHKAAGKSNVSISLQGVPTGTRMDGVYTLSLNPDCDVTGKRTKDKQLYQGDFTSNNATFLDKPRPYVDPATSLLVNARVINASGKVIKELEASTCLK